MFVVVNDQVRLKELYAFFILSNSWAGFQSCANDNGAEIGMTGYSAQVLLYGFISHH